MNPRDCVGRFAPSPTGDLHLGNARTALLAWLQVRALGGRFILRMEDLDVTRVRAGSADRIRRDLEWIGIDWDEEYTQSGRLLHYEAALEKLEIYPCTCSRKDIQEATLAPHGLEAVYPGTCRFRPLKPGVPPAMRWKIPESQTFSFEDHIEGPFQTDSATIGDFVLKRGDGVYAYHLAVVVDDFEMGITHVLRGADLAWSTLRQIALQKALGFGTPQYWHVPLMLDFEGHRMAKRSGSLTLRALREAGKTPEHVVNLLLEPLGYGEMPLRERIAGLKCGDLDDPLGLLGLS
ncbi:MAG: tRNA glutamyl-Q(34) synthetase GluQRS [Deinococcaceae bacterium]